MSGYKTGYKAFSKQTQNDFLFLIEKGLQPNHHFLDVGCGGGRIAYHAIQYLDKGRYFAFDKEDEMIDPFVEELQNHPDLLEKEPVVYLSDFNIDFNKDIKFDFIYAHSVFTHVTPELITEFMINLKKHFSKSTKFFATFHLGSEGCDIGVEHGKRKNEFDGVWYTVEYLTDIMSGLGFRTEFVGTDTENWENVKRILYSPNNENIFYENYNPFTRFTPYSVHPDMLPKGYQYTHGTHQEMILITL